jgi:uncharacterized DUF497 family protein
VIWNDQDPDGNLAHMAEHGILPHEAEYVLMNATIDEADRRHPPRRIAAGRTAAGRLIAVVYERVDDATVYPVTAFDLE